MIEELNHKQKTLLTTLSSLSDDEYCSIAELMQILDLKQRAVYLLISSTNEWLYAQHLDPIQNRRQKGYRITDKEKVRSLIQTKSPICFTSQAERMAYMYAWMIEPLKQIHFKDLQDLFQVSKTTLYADMKKMKESLALHNIELVFDLKQGYFVKGSVPDLHACLQTSLEYLLKVNHLQDLHFLDWTFCNECYQRLRQVSEQRHNEYPDYRLQIISASMTIFKKNPSFFDVSLMELNGLQETEEFQQIDLLFQNLPIACRLYLTIQLIGTKATRYLHPDLSRNNAQMLLSDTCKKIISVFKAFSGVSLDGEEELQNSLYLHMQLSLYYYQLQISIPNPLKNEVISRYPQIYQNVESICQILKERIPYPVTEDEMAYLAMHFAGHIHVDSASSANQIRILVICPSGLSTSTLLRTEIQNLFPQARVIAVSSVSNLHLYEDQADLLVSTVDLDSTTESIKVNPILTEKDKNRIATWIMTHVGSPTLDQSAMNSLLNILSKYVPEKDQEAMKQEVSRFIYGSHPLIKVQQPQFHQHLYDHLDCSRIQFCPNPTSWQQAIRLASQPLLDKKLISENYVDSIIKLINEYGPYMVFNHRIAAAHGLSEEGALGYGISLLVCRHPVEFDENNKVKIIFVLSSPDAHHHMEILKDLSTLASDPLLPEKLAQLDNAQSVLKVLKSALAETAL